MGKYELERVTLYTQDPVMPTVEVLLPLSTADQVTVTQRLFKLANDFHTRATRLEGLGDNITVRNLVTANLDLATQSYGAALSLQHFLEEERIDFAHLVRDSLNPKVKAQMKLERERMKLEREQWRQARWGGI